MYILVLSDVFSPCPNSASQRVTSFAEAFSSRGLEVNVVTAKRCFEKKRESALGKEVLIYDLKYPRLLLSFSSVVTNPIFVLLYFLMSTLIILRNGADAVLASVPNGEVVIAGFLLSRLFQIPVIIDIRDLYPPHPHLISRLPAPIPRRLNQYLLYLFSLLYKKVDKITCADVSIKKQLLSLGVSRNKVLVIPNGADASIYKPCKNAEERETIRSQYGLSMEDLIFVYAGSLVRYYPIDVVIKGLKRITPNKRENIKLLIIGYTDYSRYVNLARSLRLENKVRFVGPLPISETARLLSACDVGIVAYRGESVWGGTYGAKIFSYMSCGLPILASGPQGSVIKNMISKYRLGVYVGEPSDRNFAEGFTYFVNREDEKILMGQNGRGLVEKSYDRRVIALKVADEILRIMKMRK